MERDGCCTEAVLPIALKKQIEDTNWFFIQEPLKIR